MGNTSARALILLCKNVANSKDSQKLGTLEIRITRMKRKTCVPCFQSKFEVGGEKKKLFSQWYNSAAAFP
jgi:glutamine amidotransferase PdxT